MDEIISLYENGTSIVQLQKKFRRGNKYIRNVLLRNGKKLDRGEKSAAIVQEILIYLQI